MERPRPRLRFPRLLAAAVMVQCCARLCPSLGTGTHSPAAHPPSTTGEHCRTEPEPGAGAGWAPTPQAEGQLRTEAELLPFSGTPTRTAGHPSPQGSPQAGVGATGPAEPHGTATEQPGLSVGTAGLAAVGSKRPSPAPAPLQLGTAPTTGSASETHPGGNVTAEGATTPQVTPSQSPSSAAVPSSDGGQWGSPSTLPGWSPPGTGLVQGQGGSHNPLSPKPWAGEGPGATIVLGDGSPGTRPSIAPATNSPGWGTMRTSPFEGRVLSPTGTHQGLAGGQGSDSHPWHGTGAAWQGARSAPRPSPQSLESGGPGTRAAQPAAGTGPASLPAAGKGSALPDPTATSRVTSPEVTSPEVTSPGPGLPLGPTVGLLGPPDTEGPPEHSPVPLEQSWHPPGVPGQPLASVSTGSSAAAQSGGSPPSTGSPHVPQSPQPAPASGPAAPTSATPEPSLGTSRGVRGLSPTTGTPPAGLSLGHPLPHDSSGGGPADSPQIAGGTPMGVGDAGPWAATAPLGWQPGSLAPSPAPGPPQQPAPSQPASSLGPSTAIGITATAVTATSTIAAPTSTIAAPTSTIAAATASPALLEDVGTVTLVPGAAVLQGNVPGLTWGPLTTVPGPPQQPTHPPGTLGHGGGSGSPRASGDTDVAQPSSGPGGWPDAEPPQATLAPAAAGRAPRVFIVEDQPPLLRASLLRIPCELVLDMGFIPALQDPTSDEHQGLLLSFNQTVTPLFMSVPGFLRLEVTGIREGSVVLEYDALFAAEHVQAAGLGALLDAALGSGGTRPGLAVGTAPVLRNGALDRPLDPCALLFACRAGFVCVAGTDGNATCTSLCHRDYCKNHGICTHAPDRGPLCQCPVGSDFWFMGLRCDYRVTQQSLLGMAAGVLLSIILLGAVLAAVAIRRFKALLLEARADQTRSSYRRFCRLDDVSAQYWSRSWLPSASSLDNPAFSNSEELLHLQILDNGCCSCREDSGIAEGAKQRPALPARPPCRPSFHYDWDTSSSSMNDPMVDSGKASDISVSSWPMEPLQWTPFPLLHQLSRQRPHKARRPHSYCEGMELGNLERSWTA